MSSKKAPRAQAYLRACAAFVDLMKSDPLQIHDFLTKTAYAERTFDVDALDGFLAKAQVRP